MISVPNSLLSKFVLLLGGTTFILRIFWTEPAKRHPVVFIYFYMNSWTLHFAALICVSKVFCRSCNCPLLRIKICCFIFKGCAWVCHHPLNCPPRESKILYEGKSSLWTERGDSVLLVLHRDMRAVKVKMVWLLSLVEFLASSSGFRGWQSVGGGEIRPTWHLSRHLGENRE